MSIIIVYAEEDDAVVVVGDTNFLNILPHPMITVTKALLKATMMLSISTQSQVGSLKSHIFFVFPSFHLVDRHKQEWSGDV